MSKNVKRRRAEDWDTLRELVVKFGTVNSLLIAPMPTASTSSLLGNNECFEPVTSLMYRRTTLAGEFYVINHRLVRDLQNLGVWNSDVRKSILLSRGSIAQISGLPKELKSIYATSFDLNQKALLRHAVARQPFIDQSMSFNVFLRKKNAQDSIVKELSALLYAAWLNELITGVYYTNFSIATNTQSFTIDPETEKRLVEQMAAFTENNADEYDDPDKDNVCHACGS